MAQMVFKRREVKYLLTDEQRAEIIDAFAGYMVDDEYGKSTVCNIYYDTPTQLLIRRSIEKPNYKEKIRVRSYGPAKPGGNVFLELKKKYDHIVYKRRCVAPLEKALAFFDGTYEPKSQIEREIIYSIRRYEGLYAYCYLAYDREAFYGANDHEFRVTFDSNQRFRTTNVDLTTEPEGELILPDGLNIMEVKAGGAVPLWFAHYLTEHKLYRTSFSKIGRAYTALYKRGEVKVPVTDHGMTDKLLLPDEYTSYLQGTTRAAALAAGDTSGIIIASRPKVVAGDRHEPAVPELAVA